MLLNTKIQASSLAEVVIALAAIALCIGVASIVFTRATLVSSRFKDLKLQTEVQSMIWHQLQTNGAPVEMEDLTLTEEQDDKNDSLRLFVFKDIEDRIIWKQQWTTFE